MTIEDELLEIAPPARWPRVVAGVAALAAVLVVAVRSGTHEDDPTPAPNAVATTSVPALSPDLGDHTVPAAFRLAVATVFPGARQEAATTQRMKATSFGPQQLVWFRQYTARSDDADVFILVRQPRPHDHASSSVTRGRYATTTTVVVTGIDRTVQIRAITVGTTAPTVRALTALARDDRLVPG